MVKRNGHSSTGKERGEVNAERVTSMSVCPANKLCAAPSSASCLMCEIWKICFVGCRHFIIITILRHGPHAPVYPPDVFCAGSSGNGCAGVLLPGVLRVHTVATLSPRAADDIDFICKHYSVHCMR